MCTLRSHDNANHDLGNILMESIMGKMVESTKVGIDKMKIELSSMSHLLDSYSTSIKLHEYQIGMV